MEEREHLQPTLDNYGIFKPLKTIHLFGLQLLFTLVLNIVAIFYASVHPDQKSRCREYFIIIYLHIGLFFLTLAVDLITKWIHHNLRLNGYLEFYKQTHCHINLPFYIVSFWSAILMFIQTLMQHYYPDDFAEKCIKGGTLSPISYLCAFITLEFLTLAGININYMVRVWNFNKQKLPPDVHRENWLACTSTENLGQSEVGYKQIGERVYNMLEKQADQIRYLEENNERLGKKLMTLTAQLQQVRSSHREPSTT